MLIADDIDILALYIFYSL